MTEELRCYTFTLYQLSSIQQGIQAGHAAVELGMKAYKRQMTGLDNTDFTMYHEWATEWKTMVLLNGGGTAELVELLWFLKRGPFPYSTFHESIDSLDGILTSVAIILPASIFTSAERLRKSRSGELSDDYPEFSEWEEELVYRLSKAGLAR